MINITTRSFECLKKKQPLWRKWLIKPSKRIFWGCSRTKWVAFAITLQTSLENYNSNSAKLKKIVSVDLMNQTSSLGLVSKQLLNLIKISVKVMMAGKEKLLRQFRRAKNQRTKVIWAFTWKETISWMKENSFYLSLRHCKSKPTHIVSKSSKISRYHLMIQGSRASSITWFKLLNTKQMKSKRCKTSNSKKIKQH